MITSTLDKMPPNMYTGYGCLWRQTRRIECMVLAFASGRLLSSEVILRPDRRKRRWHVYGDRFLDAHDLHGPYLQQSRRMIMEHKLLRSRKGGEQAGRLRRNMY